MQLVIRRVAYALGLIVLFMAVLFAAATAASRIDPFREVDQMREKWAHWQAHKDEYDTLFIGTSRTYRGVMPSVFDEEMAKAGTPTRSFNFGIDGMLGPEDAYLAEYVLRDPPKKLRWLFVEIAKFSSDLENRDPENIRMSHWHDWTATWLCLRASLWPKQKAVKWKQWFRPDEDQPPPAYLAWVHTRLFFKRSLNLGRGASALDDWMIPKRAKPFLGIKGDGFNPYPAEDELLNKDVGAYQKALEFRQRTPSKLSPLKPYHQESVDRILQMVANRPVKTVLFVAPSVGPSRLRPAERPNVALIDFYDVNAYPEFFTPDVRVDLQHLNAKGADLFTRRLATEFRNVAGLNGVDAKTSNAPR